LRESKKTTECDGQEDSSRLGTDLLLKRCSHLFCRSDSICAWDETTQRLFRAGLCWFGAAVLITC